MRPIMPTRDSFAETSPRAGSRPKTGAQMDGTSWPGPRSRGEIPADCS